MRKFDKSPQISGMFALSELIVFLLSIFATFIKREPDCKSSQPRVIARVRQQLHWTLLYTLTVAFPRACRKMQCTPTQSFGTVILLG